MDWDLGTVDFIFLNIKVFWLLFLTPEQSFSDLVLALVGMLVWGAWNLLSDVFVFFQSRSKLFTGDFLELSHIHHCFPWAFQEAGEHRKLSGKNVMNTRQSVIKGCYFLVVVIFYSLACRAQFYDTTEPAQWLFATKNSLIPTPMVLQRHWKTQQSALAFCWSFFLSQFCWLAGWIWFLPKGKTAFCWTGVPV